MLVRDDGLLSLQICNHCPTVYKISWAQDSPLELFCGADKLSAANCHSPRRHQPSRALDASSLLNSGSQRAHMLTVGASEDGGGSRDPDAKALARFARTPSGFHYLALNVLENTQYTIWNTYRWIYWTKTKIWRVTHNTEVSIPMTIP